MGLLRDFLERRHQDTRDQAYREFDTYKSILTSQEKDEFGNPLFSPEQKHDALQRIVTIASPSKKHGQAILPLLQGLTGLGGNAPTGDRATQRTGARGYGEGESVGMSPGALLMGGNPADPQAMSDADVSPAVIAGMAPAPTQDEPMTQRPTASQAPPPAPRPATQVTAMPDASPMEMSGGTPANTPATGIPPQSDPANRVESTRPNNPPAAPSSQPNAQPPMRMPPAQASRTGQGINAFPSFEERMQRAQAISQFHTQIKINEMQQLAPAQAAMAQTQLDAQMQRYDGLVKRGMDPNVAAVAVGIKLPSGSFTAAKRPVPASAIGTNAQGETGYVANGQFTPIQGGFTPANKPQTTSHVEQTDNDVLDAYAAAHGNRTRNQLTPAEKVEARTRATGQMAQYEQAIRAQHADWPDDKVKEEAGKLLQHGVDLNQHRVQVQINTGEKKLSDPLENIPERTAGLDPNARDENLFNSLPTADKARVDMLLRYDVGVAPYQLTRSPEWSRAAVLAHQIDQNWNQMTFGNRQKVVQAFTIGREAQNVRSLNTVIGHMGDLKQLAAALQNSDYRMVNSIINRLRTETGSASINNFEMAAKAVVDELANVFKQSGVTDQSVRQWEPTITSKDAYRKVDGALHTGLSLLGSRVAALSGQWHNPMAMGDTPFQFLTPKSLGALQKLGVNPEALGLQAQDITGKRGAGQGSEQPKQFSSGGFNYTDVTDKFDPQFITGKKEGETWRDTDNRGVQHVFKMYQGKVLDVAKGGGK